MLLIILCSYLLFGADATALTMGILQISCILIYSCAVSELFSEVRVKTKLLHETCAIIFNCSCDQKEKITSFKILQSSYVHGQLGYEICMLGFVYTYRQSPLKLILDVRVLIMPPSFISSVHIQQNFDYIRISSSF